MSVPMQRSGSRRRSRVVAASFIALVAVAVAWAVYREAFAAGTVAARGGLFSDLSQGMLTLALGAVSVAGLIIALVVRRNRTAVAALLVWLLTAWTAFAVASVLSGPAYRGPDTFAAVDIAVSLDGPGSIGPLTIADAECRTLDHGRSIFRIQARSTWGDRPIWFDIWLRGAIVIANRSVTIGVERNRSGSEIIDVYEGTADGGVVTDQGYRGDLTFLALRETDDGHAMAPVIDWPSVLAGSVAWDCGEVRWPESAAPTVR